MERCIDLDQITVSIILTTYNRAQLLTYAIHSVLAQTYHSFELIVVDDGSTDNTKELMAQFDDQRIKYLAHEQNKGVSAARNTGLAQSTGKYVAFIDSDDEWEIDKLEKQMAFLADKQTPVFIFSNSLKIKDGSSVGYERDLAIPTQRYYYEMYSVTAPSTWVISRDVFKLTGYFDEEFYCFDDIDFLFRMGKCNIVTYYLAEVVAKRHEHSSNLSNVSFATLKAREQFYEKHKDTLWREPDYTSKLLAKMGKDALMFKNHALAHRYFLRALSYKPLRIDLWLKIVQILCRFSSKTSKHNEKLSVYRKAGCMETMHIVCSSDENMVMPAAAMLKSLFVNALSGRGVKVYFLDGGISNASKVKLLNSLKPYSQSVHFVKVDPLLLLGMEISGDISLATYFRWLIPFFLPVEIKKAIYLDVDMIVNHDISELWDIDISDEYFLAVPEQGKDCMYVSSPQGLVDYKMLGLEPNQKFFNSGVLVINLEKWRSDHIFSKLINYVKHNKEHMRLHDQDALNAILARQCGELSYQWNVLSHLFNNFPWDAGPVKDKAVYHRLIRHPFLIHFNTLSKPWQATCVHPKRHLFFHYLDMTEWKGWRPEYFYVYQFLIFFKGIIKNIKRTAIVRKIRRFFGKSFKEDAQ